jgi:hypothetical protein
VAKAQRVADPAPSGFHFAHAESSCQGAAEHKDNQKKRTFEKVNVE